MPSSSVMIFVVLAGCMRVRSFLPKSTSPVPAFHEHGRAAVELVRREARGRGSVVFIRRRGQRLRAEQRQNQEYDKQGYGQLSSNRHVSPPNIVCAQTRAGTLILNYIIFDWICTYIPEKSNINKSTLEI